MFMNNHAYHSPTYAVLWVLTVHLGLFFVLLLQHHVFFLTSWYVQLLCLFDRNTAVWVWHDNDDVCDQLSIELCRISKRIVTEAPVCSSAKREFSIVIRVVVLWVSKLKEIKWVAGVRVLIFE